MSRAEARATRSSAIADPYPYYAELRERGPLVRAHAEHRAWLVARHRRVVEALHDPRLSASRHRHLIERFPESVWPQLATLDRNLSLWMTFMERDEHQRLRRCVRGGFSGATLRAMRARIEAMVHELIDEHEPAGSMEFLTAFAKPLTLGSAAALLGVEPRDSQHFLEWSDAFVEFMGPRPTVDVAMRAQRSVLALNEYFSRWLGPGAASERPGLLSLLVRAAGGEVPMSEEQLLAQCSMFLITGHELPRHLLTNGLYTLLSHPRQWARLRADPSLATSAAREIIRFEPPPRYIVRCAGIPFEWCGEEIRAGDMIYCLPGAANRDPEVFDNPDEFDVGRTPGHHVGFGTGPYSCLGAQLGLMIVETACAELARRLPKLRLTRDAPSWTSKLSLRALDDLPVAW